MNIAAILGSPLLGLIGTFAPQAAPIISILQQFAPEISAGASVVQAAIKEGVPAFEAAKAKAPALAQAAQQLFEQVRAHLPIGASAAPHELHLENITRALSGVGMMTPEEEARWMENATPHNDPSEENSRYGSG